MVFPLLLIYSFLGTFFWTGQAALVFQAATAPKLGWRKRIVTSWNTHRQVEAERDGTLQGLLMTRGVYPFWSASLRRRLIMDNSRFTYVLDAFRSGQLQTLASLHISCNIPIRTPAPETKSLRNWNAKLQNGTWLVPWLYSTICWRTLTGSSFTKMYMSFWRGRFKVCRDQSRLLLCCVCRQRCMILTKIFHHPRFWIQNPQKQNFQTLDGRCGGTPPVHWLSQMLHFRTRGLWRMFAIDPSYFGSRVAEHSPVPWRLAMPDSGYNKITSTSVSPLDKAYPTAPQRMAFHVKWDTCWRSSWSQCLQSLLSFPSLAAGPASIHRIKDQLTSTRSPLSWMLRDSSSSFWPSTRMSIKLLPQWLQFASWIPWTNQSRTDRLSVPRPGPLSRFAVPVVCSASLVASASNAIVPYFWPELQWEPRCIAGAEWYGFGRLVAQESDLLSWTSQLFSQGVLHAPFHGQSSPCGSRPVPNIACTHGPTVFSCSTIIGCIANMEFTPQRPELPAPGDRRPPLPRKRGPAVVHADTKVSTPRDMHTDTPGDAKRTRQTRPSC